MDLDLVIARRRMCRKFLSDPVSAEILDKVLAAAARAPSAGHTQGWSFLVLEGPEQTGLFWQHDASQEWRQHPSHPGLLKAPVIILPLASSERYYERYAESDKISLINSGPKHWSTPYWLVDTSFATMLLLLAVTQEGLGALFFSLHNSPEPLLRSLGVPEGWEAIGAVAIGWPDPDERATGSGKRGWRDPTEVIHRGRW